MDRSRYTEHKYKCQNCTKNLYTDAGGWHTITLELHEPAVIAYLCPEDEHGHHRPQILDSDSDQIEENPVTYKF